MAKVTERRIVTQDWYETETTKTGWDSHGWQFDDGHTMGNDWTIVEHIHLDKFGNPFKAVAEREVQLLRETEPVHHDIDWRGFIDGKYDN